MIRAWRGRGTPAVEALLGVKTAVARAAAGAYGAAPISAPGLVRPANGARRSIEVANLGPARAWLGLDAAVAAGSGFPLPRGAYYYSDHYTGPVYAAADAGGADLRYLEV